MRISLLQIFLILKVFQLQENLSTLINLNINLQTFATILALTNNRQTFYTQILYNIILYIFQNIQSPTAFSNLQVKEHFEWFVEEHPEGRMKKKDFREMREKGCVIIISLLRADYLPRLSPRVMLLRWRSICSGSTMSMMTGTLTLWSSWFVPLLFVCIKCFNVRWCTTLCLRGPQRKYSSKYSECLM